MITLVFLFVVAVLFGAVLTWESDGPVDVGIRRPTGLLTWLTHGNWPAKVGGGLLVVGVGALLRYALVNVDVPASLKLTFGALLAAACGFASIRVGSGPGRRGVSLALGGAAFGIAYLTAYSAFGLFGYLPTLPGTALLVLTSIAAGVYAVDRGALSLACLAMLGGWLAPAFGIGDPGPQVVYGYYLGLALLTLWMVALRGWRPLVHLSLLFTVAGGVFFAWTARYYRPEHADVMLPMLVALAAVHVAMPLAERGSARAGWLERLDALYLLAVPELTSLAAVIVAPARADLAWTLLALSAVWLAAAAWLRVSGREAVAVHAVIGLVLLGFAAAVRLRDLPWELILLAFVVAAQVYAAFRSQARSLHGVLAGLALLLGAVHVIGSLDAAPGGALLLNALFVERLLAATLLVVSGRVAHRVGQSLDGVLTWVGAAWAVIAVGAELVRWDLLSLVLVVHLLLVALCAALFLLGARLRAPPALVVAAVIGVLATAGWATSSAGFPLALVLLVLAPLSLVGVAVRSVDADPESRTGRLAAATLAPLVAAIWATAVRPDLGVGSGPFAAVVAAAVALGVLLASRRTDLRGLSWVTSATDLFGFVFGGTLLVTTLIDFAPNAWSVLLELLCLAGLALGLVRPDAAADARKQASPLVFALFLALVLQANLLRLLGPPGHLSIANLQDMRWPTLLSLLWAVLGGLFTLWARRRESRRIWVAGATLLVAAVVKLVLFDFGSLGQLANILAVIAAGIVFLLVGWLAPMPPAATPAADDASPAPTPSPQPAPAASPPRQPKPATAAPRQGSDGEAGRGWVLPLVALLVITYVSCSQDVKRLLHRHELTLPSMPESAPGDDAPDPGREVELDPGDAAALDEAPTVATACSEWRDQLPADVEIYAAGGRNGRTLGFTMPGTSQVAQGFDVTVDRPGVDVVLMLGADGPAVWSVERTERTRIAGVWLSGGGRLEIVGIAAAVPVLRTSPGGDAACPAFAVTRDGVAAVGRAAQAVLARGVERIVLSSDGRAHLGNSYSGATLVSDGQRRADTYADRAVVAAGEEGLQQLLASGRLRPATPADLDAWVESYRDSNGRDPDMSGLHPGSVESGYLYRTYVVQGGFRFPAGLTGAHLATFIVPQGVPRPVGDPGQSQVLDMGEPGAASGWR